MYGLLQDQTQPTMAKGLVTKKDVAQSLKKKGDEGPSKRSTNI